LDIEKTMELFIEFYKENGEMLTQRKLYTEAAHQLVFMGWLQRIVNGGGYIRREYASGLGFIDMVILFQGEKFVFELKKESGFKLDKALNQIAIYAHRMSVKECYLLVFRRKITDIDKIGEREFIEHDGLKVHLFWI
jgi:PD-(D/E)XK nuclease superfamily